jgi:hypothetical protein
MRVTSRGTPLLSTQQHVRVLRRDHGGRVEGTHAHLIRALWVHLLGLSCATRPFMMTEAGGTEAPMLALTEVFLLAFILGLMVAFGMFLTEKLSL